MDQRRLGLLYGVGAYVLWGFFPLYWPLLKPAVPLEILSHRIVWSLVFCLIVLIANKRIRHAILLLRHRRTASMLVLASIFLSINWGVYIWAVNHDHVVESALGYYVNPLVVISFGVILLRENLRPLQWIAVSLGLIAVVVLSIDLGRLPWIALALAFSWGFYGLIKNRLSLGAVEGLGIESLIVAVPALIYLTSLGLNGQGTFGTKPGLTALLIGAGAVTAVPLLLFNGAATRLPLTMIGLLQYLNPTTQFLIGWLLRHEPMSSARWVGFIFIWSALVVLATDGIRHQRRRVTLPEPA